MRVLCTILGLALPLAPLLAEPPAKRSSPLEMVEAPTQPAAKRTFEFQDDEIGLVLRSLARQARADIVIHENVTGRVNLRTEEKTPREMIEIIVAALDLSLEDKKGVLYVTAKHPLPPGPAKQEEPNKSLEEALSGLLNPGMFKLYDSVLDYQARPETAQKMAQAKKALYDALINEGFTKDEAFRLILANPEGSLPNLNK